MKQIHQTEYQRFIASLPSLTVALGAMRIRILSLAELGPEQLGYSVDPDGNSLVGESQGDWHEDWCVIAYDDLVGDPIFVDQCGNKMPVYTAPHGEGVWKPMLIADSLEGFSEALRAIASVGQGRENPVAYDANPVTHVECERTLAQIRESNGQATLEFWSGWLKAWDE